MSRIRSIHPGLFTDEAFVSLSDAAKIFFIGLWCEADDQGVFEWKPLTLKMRLMAGSTASAEPLLAELVAVDRIKRFEAGGKSYGAVRNFRKFQRPQKPKPVYPLPPELRVYVAIDKGDDPAVNRRFELWQQQDGKCFYCQTEITHYSKRHNSFDINHRIPTSRGGSDDPDNLVAACRPCNRGKGGRSETEWMAVLRSRVARDVRLAKVDQGQLRLQPDIGANRVFAPQMEEEGGRRKDGEKEGIETTHHESVAARPPAAPAGVFKDFPALWQVWLNREGRVPAERAYAAARREVDAETILTAAGSYTAKIIAKYPTVADRERYAGLLVNWLRGARWRDWAEAAARPDVDIEPVSDGDWRSQMLYWTNPNRGGPTRERWQVEVWGPMPGDPGCRVPPHLADIVYREAGAA